MQTKLKQLIRSCLAQLATCAMLWFAFGSLAAQAAVPNLINYQSRLSDSGGNPVTSAISIQFSIYNHATSGSSGDAASASGSLLWTETYDQASGSCAKIDPDTSGYFVVQLGACVSFPSYLDFTNDTLYLGVKIGADSEASPRVRLLASPYALNATRLGNLYDSGAQTLTVTKSGTATAGTPGYNSASFSLQGSGWTGAAAANRQMKLQTTVTDANTYRFSIFDNDDNEILSLNQAGLLSVNSLSVSNNLTADKILLQDSAADNTLQISFNENASANRQLNITVGAGDRSLGLSGDLTVEATSTINQDLTTDASPAFSGLTVGTNKLFVDSVTGRIGIGTTTLDYQLNVNGDINIATSSSYKIGGANLTTANISDSSDRRYVTDAQLVVIGNVSGTNSGDISLGTANGLILNGQALSLDLASATTTGALSSADWTTFNNKVSTARTINTTGPLSGGGDLSADRTLSIAMASSTADGYLTAVDWNTFNNKLATTTWGAIGGTLSNQADLQAALNSKQNSLTLGNLTEATSSVLTINGGTGAIIGSGLSIEVKQASGAQSGFLSSTDWNTFNNKLATTTWGAIGGTLSNQADLQAALNLKYDASNPSSYITLSGLSATGPLSYDNGTGAFSISQASTSTAGYLSSADYTYFAGFSSKLATTTWGAIGGALSDQIDLQSALNAKLATTTWGAIGGTLSNQADLQSALNAKENSLGFTPYNATNPNNYIALSALSATSPLSYDSGTGIFSLATSSLNHNLLFGLQGGTTNEYYHLTSAQHTIATQAASGSQAGYLSLTDWNTFNNKLATTTWGGIGGTLSDQIDLQNALNAKLATTTWGAIGGTLSNQLDLQSALNAKENSLGFTPYNATNPNNYIALSALSATAPLSYDSGTGVFSLATSSLNHNSLFGLQGGTTNEYYHLTSAQHTIATQAASGSQAGYLSLTDWNTFNNKLATTTWGGIGGTLSDQIDLQNALNAKLATTTWGGIGGTLSNQADLQAALNAKQALHANLTSLAGLSYVSDAFVKMTGAGTFALDTTNYLATTATSSIDHNTLANLTVGDVHTQYGLLAGRSGGQTLIGGTAINNTLTLQGTSASGNTATNTNIQFKVGDAGGTTAMAILNNGYVGIGTSTPVDKLIVYNNGDVGFRLTSATGHARMNFEPASNNHYSYMVFGGTGFGWNIGKDTDSGALGGANGFYIYELNTPGGSRFVINKGGNVGIGVLNATAVLHLKAGTATTSTAPLKFTAGTNLGTPEAGAMEYDGTHLYYTDSGANRKTLIVGEGKAGGQTIIGGTAASNSLTLQSTSHGTKGKILFGTSAYDEVNNRLGIGTDAPVFKFQVNTNTAETNIANAGGDGMVFRNTNATVGSTIGIVIDTENGGAETRNAIVGKSGSLIFMYTNSGGFLEGFRLAGDGNVGIGTTSPSWPIDVVGGGRITRDQVTTAITSPTLILANNNTTDSNYAGIDFRTVDDGGGLEIPAAIYAKFTHGASATAANLEFYTNSTTITGDPKMIITSAGNVGIGTIAPEEKLSVNGNISMEASGTTLAGTGAYYQFKRESDDWLAGRIEQTYSSTGGYGTNMSFWTNTGTSQSSLTRKMTILGSGNVGIGVTNPSAKLAFGNSGASAYKTYASDDQAGLDFYVNSSSPYTRVLDIFARSGTDVSNNGGSEIRFLTNPNTFPSVAPLTRMLIDKDGYVSIGTATNPTAKLQVMGLLSAPVSPGVEEIIKLTKDGTGGVSYPEAASFALGTYSSNGAGNGYGPDTRLDIRLKSTSSTNYNTDVTVMTFQDNGLTGIGTTTPTAVLHLKAGTATASTAPLKFTSGTLLTTAEAGAVEYLSGQFYIRGTDGLSVAGNVGIGTTTLAAKLEVVEASNDIVSFHNTSGTGLKLANGGTSWTTISDARLKENINDLVEGDTTNLLNKVLTLRPINYDIKNDPKSRRQIGFIAQEVEPLFPELVSAPKKDDEYYGISYDRFGVLAIGAIKEQQLLITDIQSTVATSSAGLQNLIVSLDTRLLTTENNLSLLNTSTTQISLTATAANNLALALQGNVNDLSATTANLSQSAQTLQGSFNLLSDNVQTLTANLNDLQESTNILGVKIADLTEQQNNIVIELQALKNSSSLQGNPSGNLSAINLEVSGYATVLGNLTVKKHIQAGQDTVGQAKILTGAQEVNITFAEEYDYQPVVVASLSGDNALSQSPAYSIINETTKGFTIKLNAPATADLIFNWHALAAESGKIFISDGTTNDITINRGVIIPATPPAEEPPLSNSTSTPDETATSTPDNSSPSTPPSDTEPETPTDEEIPVEPTEPVTETSDEPVGENPLPTESDTETPSE